MITQTSNIISKTFVPKLRFKEFEEEWEEKKLGEVGELINGLTYSPNDITDDGVLVLRSSNIQNNRLAFEDNVYVNVSSFNPVKENDILICVRNGSKRLIGKNCLIDKNNEGIAFGAFMTIYRSLNNKFIFQLFSLSSYLKKIHQNLGATINSINNNDLRKFKFFFPSLPEQKKIADFLSSVDNKLQHLKKKKELLEQYKKGLMQKIFSQEIRFKDDNGNDYPDWEEKKLGEVAVRINKKNRNGKVDLVLTNSAKMGIVSQSDFFNRDIANKSNLNGYYIVSAGDFVYNPRISNDAPVGPIKRNKFAKGLMSPLYSVFRFNSGVTDYFDWYFESSFWHSYMKAIANYGARHDRMNISISDFYLMPLKLPSLPEQQKIADFLSSVDNKLQHLKKKKELLELYKKGLMQKIFSQEIRFKDDNGNDYPDWEEKKLGEIENFEQGDGDWILSKDIIKDGKYKIIQLGNIGFGRYINKKLKTISNHKFKELNGTPIHRGDLLINRMVDDNLYACVFDLDGDFITSVDVCWIRSNKKFDNYFLMSLILSYESQKKLLRLSSGSGRVRISKMNFFNEFSFTLPCFDEQKKIADFLSSVDNKIELVDTQITQTESFKKGLLQQMFV